MRRSHKAEDIVIHSGARQVLILSAILLSGCASSSGSLFSFMGPDSAHVLTSRVDEQQQKRAQGELPPPVKDPQGDSAFRA